MDRAAARRQEKKETENQARIEKNMKEWNAIKAKVKDELTDYLYSKTKRKPMILPVILNV